MPFRFRIEDFDYDRSPDGALKSRLRDLERNPGFTSDQEINPALRVAARKRA